MRRWVLILRNKSGANWDALDDESILLLIGRYLDALSLVYDKDRACAVSNIVY